MPNTRLFSPWVSPKAFWQCTTDLCHCRSLVDDLFVVDRTLLHQDLFHSTASQQEIDPTEEYHRLPWYVHRLPDRPIVEHVPGLSSLLPEETREEFRSAVDGPVQSVFETMWSDRSDRPLGRMSIIIGSANARSHPWPSERWTGSIVSRASSRSFVNAFQRWEQTDDQKTTRRRAKERSTTRNQQSNEQPGSLEKHLPLSLGIELHQTYFVHLSLLTVGHAQRTRPDPLFAHSCSWRSWTTNDRGTPSFVSLAEEWLVDDLSDSSHLRSTQRTAPQSIELLAIRVDEQRWWIVRHLGEALLRDQRVLRFSRTITNEDRRGRTSEDRIEVKNCVLLFLLRQWARCSSVTFRQLLGLIVKQLRKDVSFHRCETLIKEVIEEFCSSFQTTLSLIDCSTPIRVSGEKEGEDTNLESFSLPRLVGR